MANSNNNAITWNSVNGLNGMKDSLPEGWHLATIADLFDIQQGKALSPKAKEGISPKPFLRTANVLWGHLDLTNVDEMDFSDEEVNRLELKKGDLLVCEGGDIGRTAMWEGQLSICMYQNHIHRLRKKVWDIDPTFFMFWMQSAITQQGLYAGEGNKTTIPNLSKSRLSAFQVPVPPFSEQRSIAHVLRTVQQAKEATEKVVAAARQLKQSLMQHLFTYGPVAVDKADASDTIESDIGTIPITWKLQEFDELFESRLGKMLSQAARTGNFSRPYLRNANVQWGKVDLTDVFEMDFDSEEQSAFRLLPGDALICEGGEVGRTAIWRGELKDCYYQKALHRARPRNDRISTEFLMYHMMNAFLIRNCYGLVGTKTTIAHLPGVKLKTLQMPVPPKPEQDKIVDWLSIADRKIQAEEGFSHSIDQLFKTLLHCLMTGKIRLPEFAAGNGK